MNRTLSSSEEESFEKSIRPQRLAEYLGQDSVREQMEIFIKAASNRGEALDHVLLFGPPGLGKTTLATIIAFELRVNIKHTSGPVIERAGDLAAILTNLEEKDILFIDEIHRLNPLIEEILYPAMEDYKIDIMIGQGPSARAIKLDLPRFTLIGATTRAGLLTSPLRDRFGIVERLDFYPVEILTKIVKRSANILNLEIDEFGALEIAKRSRKTPRIANRLLRRVRDFTEVKYCGRIDGETASKALNLLEIDVAGFDILDRKLLDTMIKHFNGGPVGVESLVAALNEERQTIEEVVEPYLIQEGYIVRTNRGRLVTKKAYLHLNYQYPKEDED